MSELNKKPEQTNPDSYSPKMPKLAGLMDEANNYQDYPEVYSLPDRRTPIPPEITRSSPAGVQFALEFSYFMDYSGQGYGFVNDSAGGWRTDVSFTLADIISGHALRPCSLAPSAYGLDKLYEAAGFPSCGTFYAGSEKDYYAGPEITFCSNMEYNVSESRMKDAIRYTLYTLGQPVILSPTQDWSRYNVPAIGAIVVGYKQGGDILEVFYYTMFSTEGQTVEIKDWYNADTKITVVGRRENTPTAKELYTEGLRQIRDYLRAGVHGADRHYYDDWENFLRLSIDEMIAEVTRTRVVPGANMWRRGFQDENILKYIYQVADPAWCKMAEHRFYVMHFFNQAAEFFPNQRESLQELANHFGAVSRIMGKEYISEVGHDPVNAEAFGNPEVRARMADCVRRFREADGKGLEMAETLLVHLAI